MTRRPQASLADFYRELGELFGVPLRPHNRWASAKALRDRWLQHIDTALSRPVLLVDEAQEMAPTVFAELRLLASAELDSRSILTAVLAGDDRLCARLETPELLPLASRIRARLRTEALPAADLLTAVMLMFCLAQVGPTLVLVPAVAWLYWTGDNVWGTVLLVWTVFVGTLDNFLRPYLIKMGADLPLLLIFAGVIGGLISLGLLGIFVGPVVLAVGYTLLEAWVDDPAEKPAAASARPEDGATAKT